MWISEKDFNILRDEGKVTVEKLFTAGYALTSGDTITVHGDGLQMRDEDGKNLRELEAKVTEFRPSKPRPSLELQLVACLQGNPPGDYKAFVSLEKA